MQTIIKTQCLIDLQKRKQFPSAACAPGWATVPSVCHGHDVQELKCVFHEFRHTNPLCPVLATLYWYNVVETLVVVVVVVLVSFKTELFTHYHTSSSSIVVVVVVLDRHSPLMLSFSLSLHKNLIPLIFYLLFVCIPETVFILHAPRPLSVYFTA